MSKVHNHDYDPTCKEYSLGGVNGGRIGSCLTGYRYSKSTPENEDTTGENNPESPNHYSRLKALTGVETWDILDFVAGNDPDMWNLGKYWFRMGYKEGQSTLTEKKKMLKYLERSIEKEESSTE